MSDYIDILSEIFTDCNVDINEDDEYVIEDKNNNNCITFNIFSDKNQLYIDMLDKCDALSGTQTLEKIEEFAKRIGINEIRILDATELIFCNKKVEFDLRILYILTTGETLYNSKGYYIEKQTEINAHNKQIIKMNIIYFLNNVKQNNKYNKIINTYIDKIYTLNINNITVKQYFIFLKICILEYTLDETIIDCKKLTEISMLIKAIKKSLILKIAIDNIKKLTLKNSKKK
jgi:hypothetical protein